MYDSSTYHENLFHGSLGSLWRSSLRLLKFLDYPKRLKFKFSKKVRSGCPTEAMQSKASTPDAPGVRSLIFGEYEDCFVSPDTTEPGTTTSRSTTSGSTIINCQGRPINLLRILIQLIVLQSFVS